MNFALEELRQVDWLVIKIKKVPFPLFSRSSLFQSLAIVRTFFFCTQLCKPQNFAFALSKFFGILSSLLSPYSPWQTSRLAFAFSQAYIFHIRVSFFTSNLDSQHLTSALSTMNIFSAVAFAEGYNY
ncbi:MAG: hypothetical protein V3U92_05645 [Cellulophaga sp.]